MKSWSDENTISLIKMYEQYDPDLLKYKDNLKSPELKMSLWGIIAEVHKTTVPEVQNKIKLLRTKFADERRRYEYDSNYFKHNPWRFFRNCMFLMEEEQEENELRGSSAISESCLKMKIISEQKQKVCLKLCVANKIPFATSLKMLKKAYGEEVLSEQQANEYYKSFKEDSEIAEDMAPSGPTSIDERIQEIFDSESNCSSKQFGTEERCNSMNFGDNVTDHEHDDDKIPANKKRKLNDPEASLENALKCIKTLLDESDKRDEHSIYGEHIAHRLRTCNRNNSDIAIAQHHIENIVFNLTMGKYRQEATDTLEVKTNLVIPPIITRSVPDPVIIPKTDPES